MDPLQMATIICIYWASQVALVVKNWPANAGNITDVGSVPGLARSPGGRNGNPLQYPCPGNPMDTEVWQATVLRVSKELDTTSRLKNNNPDIAKLPSHS